MNIANKISTFRILSVPFFVASIIYYSPQKDYLRLVALGIFLLGVFSDAVDGYIARKAKQSTPAGMVLDPLGDKILLMSAFIFLHFFNTGIRFPLWVVLVVVSRDAIILLGIIAIFFIGKKLDMRPSNWGKLTTSLQMLAVICLLGRFQFTFLLWQAAVIFTLISGADYIRKGFKLLYGPAGNFP